MRGGGGAKAVWNFSENSSVLEWGSFPKEKERIKKTNKTKNDQRNSRGMLRQKEKREWREKRKKVFQQVKAFSRFITSLVSTADGFAQVRREKQQAKKGEGTNHNFSPNASLSVHRY